MGSSIIFFSTPAYGHLISVYPVIKELVAQGHSVKWYCSAKYRSFVESSGAQFIEYIIDFDSEYNLSHLISNFYVLFDNLLELNRICYTTYIEDTNLQDADLILYDSMCSYAKNIALKLNKPHICFCTTLAYNAYTFVFSNMFWSTIQLYLKHHRQIFRKIREENKYRKQHGIARLKLMDFFVNAGQKTIVFSPKEFQPFVKTFNSTFEFVGTTIKERINLRHEDYSHYDVYVSLGTILTENESLLTDILSNEALQQKKVIVTVGQLELESKFPGVECVPFTVQLKLLPQCDLFINHGGLSSVYESLYQSVVQVCIPSQEEHRMTATIVDKLGLGLHMPLNKPFDFKRLEQLKEQLTDNVAQFSTIMKSYDGTALAVDIINQFLKEG
ncbi:MAG: hypothetical protein Q4A10_00965 [Aerococcaceae bacterium]|nr:hypothetical protein [Aerococcaceae bacterium]